MINRTNFLHLAVAGLASLSTFASAAPFAYVPNEGSGTVTVIDTASDEVVANIPTGKKPRGLAISGNWLYVSDQPNNRLQMIDLQQRKAAGVIALGESPEGVYASPDGRWIAAAMEESHDVAITDTQTNKVAFTIKGVKGPDCLSETKFLEQALGGGVLEQQKTGEYYEQSEGYSSVYTGEGNDE